MAVPTPATNQVNRKSFRNNINAPSVLVLRCEMCESLKSDKVNLLFC